MSMSMFNMFESFDYGFTAEPYHPSEQEADQDSDRTFLWNQLAQRAQWAQDDWNRYQKAKFFLSYGNPLSVHVAKNMETVQWLENHYSWKDNDD